MWRSRFGAGTLGCFVPAGGIRPSFVKPWAPRRCIWGPSREVLPTLLGTGVTDPVFRRSQRQPASRPTAAKAQPAGRTTASRDQRGLFGVPLDTQAHAILPGRCGPCSLTRLPRRQPGGSSTRRRYAEWTGSPVKGRVGTTQFPRGSGPMADDRPSRQGVRYRWVARKRSDRPNLLATPLDRRHAAPRSVVPTAPPTKRHPRAIGAAGGQPSFIGIAMDRAWGLCRRRPVAPVASPHRCQAARSIRAPAPQAVKPTQGDVELWHPHHNEQADRWLIRQHIRAEARRVVTAVVGRLHDRGRGQGTARHRLHEGRALQGRSGAGRCGRDFGAGRGNAAP